MTPIPRYSNVPAAPAAHKQRVMDELKRAGASWFIRQRDESRYLPSIIHHDERIEAVVYGHHQDGTAMLVATDRRVIYLDKKWLFIQADELTYDVVGGVNFGSSGLFTLLTLHTRVGDFTLRIVGSQTANRFVEFIEKRCLDRIPPEPVHSWGPS